MIHEKLEENEKKRSKIIFFIFTTNVLSVLFNLTSIMKTPSVFPAVIIARALFWDSSLSLICCLKTLILELIVYSTCCLARCSILILLVISDLISVKRNKIMKQWNDHAVGERRGCIRWEKRWREMREGEADRQTDRQTEKNREREIVRE